MRHSALCLIRCPSLSPGPHSGQAMFFGRGVLVNVLCLLPTLDCDSPFCKW